jgi:hypothetical protein
MWTSLDFLEKMAPVFWFSMVFHGCLEGVAVDKIEADYE